MNISRRHLIGSFAITPVLFADQQNKNISPVKLPKIESRILEQIKNYKFASINHLHLWENPEYVVCNSDGSPIYEISSAWKSPSLIRVTGNITSIKYQTESFKSYVDTIKEIANRVLPNFDPCKNLYLCLLGNGLFINLVYYNGHLRLRKDVELDLLSGKFDSSIWV